MNPVNPMNPLTPDPKKRGYLLPPGKDLHDVLQRESQSQSDALDTPGAEQFLETGEWPLGDLVPWLTTIIESGAGWSWLSLTSPEPELNVYFFGGKHGGPSVNLQGEIGTGRNEVIREFCRRHHLPLPEEGAMPPRLRFDVPVYQLYRLDPVLPGPAATAGLVRMLFEEVAGLTEDASISFRCTK